MDNPEREDCAAKGQPLGENCPLGNISDTLGGIDGTYPLQGIGRTTGIALLERTALILRHRAPLPDDIDALVGWAALILLDLASKPKADSANAADMWALSIRG